MTSKPYLAGDSDMGQLKMIFMALGTPTEDDWPNMKVLHLAVSRCISLHLVIPQFGWVTMKVSRGSKQLYLPFTSLNLPPPCESR